MPTHPTALDIIHSQNLTHALPDKVILITGCSSGIGAATARALAHTDATLFLAVRDIPKAQHVLADLLTPAPESSTNSTIHLLPLDLASLTSVRHAATEFLRHSDRLHILIANGAVMATPPGRTADGFETQFATNHLGHFLLFALLAPVLLRSATEDFHARVVGVTSSAHRKSGVDFETLGVSLRGNGDGDGDGYDPARAYAQSKTANIYMMNEIERRFGARGLHGLSVHPGDIFTGLQKHVDEEILREWRRPEMKPYLKTAEQGAATVVVAAVGREWEGRGGVYLEDCREGEPARPGCRAVDPGYAMHIWDQESAERLWEESRRMVGVHDDRKGNDI
ncbi:short-chain dehydrogenase [Aspergillus clavatus NRRL 1]|uniref:Short-chain dehydrogenase n=1 Tax=Aspergillus clavatus (strain ATCC 1007 / CBS 513.65 / DSM 816 / NCTC 3887 / NRRL 1 / QM 1276 / 107) TaxID=344612 RepID=A1CUG1_ASPCL|nr:short-chain dehydrogenase [Aspergillus clavatus NRRL 1]EAW06948.1 short-chain dehydrogenase [Aspergillus clavatus NRRL 1]